MKTRLNKKNQTVVISVPYNELCTIWLALEKFAYSAERDGYVHYSKDVLAMSRELVRKNAELLRVIHKSDNYDLYESEDEDE